MTQAWENEVRHQVGNTISFRHEARSTTVYMPCEVCKTTKEFIMSGRAMPPDVVKKKIAKAGWRYGKHLACPDCVKLRPNALKKRRVTTQRTLPTSSIIKIAAALSTPATPPPRPAELPGLPENKPAALAMPDGAKKLNGLGSLGQLMSGVSTTQMQSASITDDEILDSIVERARPMVEAALEQGPRTPAERAAAHAKAVPKAEKPQRAPVVRQKKEKKPVGTVTPIATTRAPSEAAQAPAKAPAEATASPGANKAHRAVMRLLEDYFDEEKKQFREDWDDAKISRETGAAEKYVADTREKYFGALAEPDELVLFRQEAEAISKAMAKVEADFQAAMQPLREQQKALLDLFAETAMAKGWTK